MATPRLTRRHLLARMLAASAGTTVAPLARARAATGHCLGNQVSRGFGPLSPRLARNAAELRRTVVGDLSRVPLLALPEGFSFNAVSLTGERMDDGRPVPAMHDGMGCFKAGDGRLRLVRNHELVPGQTRFGNRAGAQPANGLLYDRFALPPGVGGGGTTTLEMDGEGRLLGHWGSLGGTVRNCAGGPTPWGSWLSCEENVDTPATARVLRQRHGYVFEVPAALEDGVEPLPITGMGRFMHEAVACDPASGRCYLTEDTIDGCLYRYTPDVRPASFGDLQRGGQLHALAIDTSVVADCDDSRPHVTRGGSVDTRQGVRSLIGQPLPVRWIALTEPDPAGDTLRHEAHAGGAALFARGEGAWYGNGLVHFVCTTGGDARRGQVWAFDPAAEIVTLLLESTGAHVLENPDNITIAADGTLYLMEDGPGGNTIVGVDRDGGVFPFVRNALRFPGHGGAADTSEFAGGCFSPDGRLFFVNSQGMGITYAVFRDDGEALLLPA